MSIGNQGREDCSKVGVARRQLWQREAKGRDEIGQILQAGVTALGREKIYTSTEHFEKSKLHY